MSATAITELLEFEALRSAFLVFRGSVVATFALRTFKGNDVSHNPSELPITNDK